jgi:hypothetical protein
MLISVTRGEDLEEERTMTGAVDTMHSEVAPS